MRKSPRAWASFVLPVLMCGAAFCDILDEVADAVDRDRLRDVLQFVAKQPHVAGSEEDEQLGLWIADQFRQFGLDRVQVDQYDMLFSLPDPDKPNVIRIRDSTGRVRFESRTKEEPLKPSDSFERVLPAHLAYSPSGKVQVPLDQLVYVNYAREQEDFAVVDQHLGHQGLQGKICIARFGKVFRGNKIRACQDRGAIGVILFTDPQDVAVLGTHPDAVYPNTILLPGTGIQRGGGKTFLNGDPLSPEWASVPNAFRLPVDQATALPGILSQPIGYDDAKLILQKMGGPKAPDHWIGGLEGVAYNLGAEALPEFVNWTLTLEVNNFLNDSRGSNVIGVIEGAVEPDRYVMLMSQRDAWAYGAVDPSSGTTLLVEVARILGQQVRTGWRPRRSIVLASWTAEEFGLLGSTEWLYDKWHKLHHRTVAGINVDSCVAGGPIFAPSSSPSLFDLPVQVSRTVQDPEHPDRSFYESWSDQVSGDPKTALISSGSDHAPYVFEAGIPMIRMRFKVDDRAFPGVSSNPTYHTAYEDLYLVQRLVDPEFKYHKLCTQMAAKIMLTLSQSALLPFNHLHLVALLQNSLADLIADGTEALLQTNNVTLKYLQEAVDSFVTAVDDVSVRLSQLDVNQVDALMLRALNDQIMYLERVFIQIDGHVPTGRRDARHLIYSPPKYNRYGVGVFPAIKDLLYEIQKRSCGSDCQQALWTQVRKHISDLMIAIRQAAHFLQPFQFI